MIDIGVNLTNRRFEKDLAQVLERAQDVGVSYCLVTGTSVEESRLAIDLCQQYPLQLASTCGVHPHDADNASDDFIDQIRQLVNQHPCVKAIGECSLDFNRNFSTPENQLAVFKQQIALAAELDLPLFLHQRDAFEPWFECLKPYLGKVPAMVAHCFTGNEQELQTCLSHDMYIGITGWVCDERRGQELQAIVNQIPLNRLMIETDAPYLTPRTIRPRPKSSRNEPAYLPYVVETLATLYGVEPTEIVKYSSENAARVFGLEYCHD